VRPLSAVQRLCANPVIGQPVSMNPRERGGASFTTAIAMRSHAMEQPTPIISIAIVDQERVFVEALGYRLKGEPELRIVYAGEPASDGVPSVDSVDANVLLLDAEMPLGQSLDLAHEVRRTRPSARILFLMRAATNATLDQALRTRPNGILTRAESLTRLIEAIKCVARGEYVFSESIAHRIGWDSNDGGFRLRVDAPSTWMTDRQLEILRHLARGESVKSVAQRLYLSPKSVDNQKFRIMNKIGVRDKVSLALYAVREGLILP
jgi:DNA-binding NarL/FixJ family response regulator